MTNPKLYPARCPKCREVVTYTLEGGHVLCPRCHVWTMARPDTAEPAKPAARRTAPIRETRAMQWEQLAMF